MAAGGPAGAQPARALHRDRAQAARPAPHAGEPGRRARTIEGARASARGGCLPENAQESRRAIARGASIPRLTAIGSLVAGVAFAAPAFSERLSDLAAFDPGSADIVILGEVHDNRAHHEAQAELVARIEPAAVVFEMLTPEQAATVEQMGSE